MPDSMRTTTGFAIGAFAVHHLLVPVEIVNSNLGRVDGQSEDVLLFLRRRCDLLALQGRDRLPSRKVKHPEKPVFSNNRDPV